MRNKLNLLEFTGKVLIFFGGLSILNGLVSKLYHVGFSSYFLLLGILLTLLGFLKLFIIRPVNSRGMKFLVTIVHVLILFLILSFILIEGLIVSSAFNKETTKPDYIVILGAGLWGETPSLALLERLDESISIINKYPDVKVVLSGGQGAGETISESLAMKRYLINKGIEKARLIEESKSTSTLENICYTRAVLRKVDSRENIKITIVSNNFHIFRAKLLAKRAGFIAYGFPTKIHPFLAPTYFIREYFALVKSLIFDIPSIIPYQS